jgi:hypothetical protein
MPGEILIKCFKEYNLLEHTGSRFKESGVIKESHCA